MFPAARAARFARNVVHRGISALFQFLLGLAMVDMAETMILANRLVKIQAQ